MSPRFAVTVLLLIASFAGLFALGSGEWNLHVEQRHALGRVKSPDYFDDCHDRPQWDANARPSEAA